LKYKSRWWVDLPDEAIAYVLWQRTNLVRETTEKKPGTWNDVVPKEVAEADLDYVREKYNSGLMSDLLCIAGHLPKRCESIVDIGCGVAGLDVLLWRYYTMHWQKPYITLLDKTRTEGKIWYGYTEQAAYYNSLEVAKRVMRINGVGYENFGTCNPDGFRADRAAPIIATDTADLVVSSLAWGFHFPVMTYRDQVADVLAQHGVVIMWIRNGTDGVQKMLEAFDKAERVFVSKKYTIWAFSWV